MMVVSVRPRAPGTEGVEPPRRRDHRSAAPPAVVVGVCVEDAEGVAVLVDDSPASPPAPAAGVAAAPIPAYDASTAVAVPVVGHGGRRLESPRPRGSSAGTAAPPPRTSAGGSAAGPACVAPRGAEARHGRRRR